MEKLEIDGKIYEIEDRFETTDIDTALTQFDTVETSTRRIHTFFAWLPYHVEGRFAWLKTITVEETLHFYRVLKFDDGWSYRNYWSEWKPKWVINKIL
jgi:hypothetical protein